MTVQVLGSATYSQYGKEEHGCLVDALSTRKVVVTIKLMSKGSKCVRERASLADAYFHPSRHVLFQVPTPRAVVDFILVLVYQSPPLVDVVPCLHFLLRCSVDVDVECRRYWMRMT